MNIEFIKWLVGYAEGFELSVMSIGDYDPDPKYSVDIATSTSIGFGAIQGLGDSHSYAVWHYIYYPLLLQRAIEGINREHFNQGSTKKPIYIKIAIDKYEVIDSRILNDYNYFYFSAKMNHDQTKEEALKYTWEKMG